MLDDLFDLNWSMGGTRGLFEIFQHGLLAGHTFYIGLASGWSGPQVEGLLNEQGIEVYGRAIVPEKGDFLFTVETEQAEEAERILLLAGVPLRYHLFSERNIKYLRG